MSVLPRHGVGQGGYSPKAAPPLTLPEGAATSSVGCCTAAPGSAAPFAGVGDCPGPCCPTATSSRRRGLPHAAESPRLPANQTMIPDRPLANGANRQRETATAGATYPFKTRLSRNTRWRSGNKPASCHIASIGNRTASMDTRNRSPAAAGSRRWATSCHPGAPKLTLAATVVQPVQTTLGAAWAAPESP